VVGRGQSPDQAFAASGLLAPGGFDQQVLRVVGDLGTGCDVVACGTASAPNSNTGLTENVAPPKSTVPPENFASTAAAIDMTASRRLEGRVGPVISLAPAGEESRGKGGAA